MGAAVGGCRAVAGGWLSAVDWLSTRWLSTRFSSCSGDGAWTQRQCHMAQTRRAVHWWKRSGSCSCKACTCRPAPVHRWSAIATSSWRTRCWRAANQTRCCRPVPKSATLATPRWELWEVRPARRRLRWAAQGGSCAGNVLCAADAALAQLSRLPNRGCRKPAAHCTAHSLCCTPAGLDPEQPAGHDLRHARVHGARGEGCLQLQCQSPVGCHQQHTSKACRWAAGFRQLAAVAPAAPLVPSLSPAGAGGRGVRWRAGGCVSAGGMGIVGWMRADEGQNLSLPFCTALLRSTCRPRAQ